MVEPAAKHIIETTMQQITLERGDLLQLVPISNSGTIQLLPLGKKFKVRKPSSFPEAKEN